MHLISKNFGKQPSSVMPSTLSTKGGYFSSLSLGGGEDIKEVKKTENQKQKVKNAPKGFIPEKFALSFDPPCIILEYTNPDNKKRYHHKMPIKKLKKDTPIKDVLQYLKKKHYHYFMPKVIDQTQVEKLIQKLKLGLGVDNKKSQIGDVQEQDDFDFDYEQSFDN